MTMTEKKGALASTVKEPSKRALYMEKDLLIAKVHV